ncbi:hypothetical protein O6P43_033658 [Quillaja saponaria]|uniref:Uncharacterized protein n=1 Tax=Quillaja saponaria TaxID=32244 RepID=A0AAD7KS59_QUISA|nr:hypothetical protein O6P43_033658 [Quillaja saponaria]
MTTLSVTMRNGIHGDVSLRRVLHISHGFGLLAIISLILLPRLVIDTHVPYEASECTSPLWLKHSSIQLA